MYQYIHSTGNRNGCFAKTHHKTKLIWARYFPPGLHVHMFTVTIKIQRMKKFVPAYHVFMNKKKQLELQVARLTKKVVPWIFGDLLLLQ